jgi:hypothetical protein
MALDTMLLEKLGGALWWGSVAEGAPWFFHGTSPSAGSSPFASQLGGITAVMVLAVVTSCYGAARTVGNWLGSSGLTDSQERSTARGVPGRVISER